MQVFRYLNFRAKIASLNIFHIFLPTVRGITETNRFNLSFQGGEILEEHFMQQNQKQKMKQNSYGIFFLNKEMCCYDHEQFQVDDVLTLPSDVF